MQNLKFKIQNPKWVKLALGIFLLATSYKLLVNSVFAQQVTLTVDPAQIEILMKPGTSLIKTFSFQNLGDANPFSFKVVSFEPQGDQGGIMIKDKAEGPLRFSLENPGYLLNQDFFLSSQEQFQALLKIRAIDNAPEGDYYYLLLFTSQAPVSQQTGSQNQGGIAANILVSISKNGLTTKTAQVALLEILPRYRLNLFGKSIRLVDTADSIPVVLKLANTGKNLIVPDPASLILRGPYLNDQRKTLIPYNVLANSNRLLKADDGSDNCSACSIPVTTTFKGFFLGHYQLSAEISLSGSNQKLYQRIDFWGLPLKLIGNLSWFFLFLALCYLFLRRQRQKKHK